ncbi:MAG: MoaD/ThiS family protein [Chloroflexota bacterium]
MLVDLRLYSTLRQYAGGLKIGEPMRVELPDGASISILLAKIGVPEHETKQAFVNGRSEEMDFPLKDGDQVGVFPPVAGG